MKSLNVVYFPFAGGTSFSLDSLKKAMPSDWNFVALEYPGRGTRWNTPLISEPETLLNDLQIQILERIQTSLPTIFIGYSFGALLAYRMCSKIKELDLLGLIIISAKSPSHVVSDRSSHTYLSTDEALKKHIISLGGIPDEIAQNEVMMSMILPIVKADLLCYSTIQFEPESITLPILYFFGCHDPIITHDHANYWLHETSNEITTEIIKLHGNHFCHEKNEAFIIDEISEWIHRVSSFDRISL